MNPYVRNVLRGFGCGLAVWIILVLVSLVLHRFISLWMAIWLAVLPYIVTLFPSVRRVVLDEPLKILTPLPRTGTWILRRFLMMSFVVGYFAALIACLYLLTMSKIVL